jgi:hypothetical protein
LEEAVQVALSSPRKASLSETALLKLLS